MRRRIWVLRRIRIIGCSPLYLGPPLAQMLMDAEIPERT